MGRENWKSSKTIQKAADDVLMVKYAPPGVIVNNEMDIVQFRGATGMWLEPSPGKTKHERGNNGPRRTCF
jgi:two-component system, chemotaxis family, CheB/CheR fusion protein